MAKKREYSRRRGFIVLIAGLIIFWFVITGDVSFYSMTLGIASSCIIAYTQRHLIIGEPIMTQRPILEYLRGIEHSIVLFFSALWYVIYANAFLIYQAISLDIEPKIVRVQVKMDSDLELTVISNLITLTPGTLVIDLEEGEEGTSYLYVHFSYLKSKHLGESISDKVGRWDALIGGMFR